MNEESDEKPNSQISEDGAKREQPSTSLSLHGKWEWWGVGLSAFFNKSQVKRRERIVSHRPKSVLRSKTEEGSRQREAKETIDEEKEHAESETDHHTVEKPRFRTFITKQA
ncbi:hypothetical protein Bca4012_099006 [Brassica carinata]